jgi:hypothetical protein
MKKILLAVAALLLSVTIADAAESVHKDALNRIRKDNAVKGPGKKKRTRKVVKKKLTKPQPGGSRTVLPIGKLTPSKVLLTKQPITKGFAPLRFAADGEITLTPNAASKVAQAIAAGVGAIAPALPADPKVVAAVQGAAITAAAFGFPIPTGVGP